MTDLDLARRAVACKNWKWMPGMLSSHKARYLGADIWIDSSAHSGVYADANDGEVPDLNDPATVGCLLALVREAWGDPMLFAFPDAFPDRWNVVNVDIGDHVTEAAALVAALENAP